MTRTRRRVGSRRTPRLSKEAWAAITAITVALISTLSTLVMHYVPPPVAR